MKTAFNIKCACKMATAMCAVWLVGNAVCAQPLPDANKDYEIRKALERLDALMINVEQAARYAAPADIFDDIRSAWESLELLAENTQNEIRYKAPAEKPVTETERTYTHQSPENHSGVFLTYYFASNK